MKNNLVRRFLGCFVLTACASVIFAEAEAIAYDPLRTPSKLAAPVRETVLHVPTARVVLADYGLIRRDFVVTRPMTDAQVDAWLLKNTAYVSKAQASQALANTPIQVDVSTVNAFRPKDYGRALVFEVEGGLIDVKGTGRARAPQPGGHSDGLATLGEVTREFLYEKLVRTILKHSGSAFETVEHYAVVDLGFEVKHADGSTSPAGLILRQAHERVTATGAMLDDAGAREVELTLRRYGLTSAGAYRGAANEQINVQGTPDHGILDFGGYLGVEKFEKPARNFHSFVEILDPGQIDFVQPKAEIRVPLEHWGYSESGVADPKLDNPWLWSHKLANDFRSGQASRQAFKDHFENMVGGYRRALFLTGGEADSVAMEMLVRAAHDIR